MILSQSDPASNRFRCFVITVAMMASAIGCRSSAPSEPPVPTEQFLFGTTEDIHMTAIGADYAWEFVAPGLDGTPGTLDDISFGSVLWLPPDRPVEIRFESRDYVYTFLQETLKINEIAVPGVATQATFVSPANGEFDISASPLCGFMFAHAGYRPYIKIGLPRELHTIVKSLQSQPGSALNNENISQ